MPRTQYWAHVKTDNQDFIVGNLVRANRLGSIAQHP
jgi:hypothetical protein